MEATTRSQSGSCTILAFYSVSEPCQKNTQLYYYKKHSITISKQLLSSCYKFIAVKRSCKKVCAVKEIVSECLGWITLFRRFREGFSIRREKFSLRMDLLFKEEMLRKFRGVYGSYRTIFVVCCHKYTAKSSECPLLILGVTDNFIGMLNGNCFYDCHVRSSKRNERKREESMEIEQYNEGAHVEVDRNERYSNLPAVKL